MTDHLVLREHLHSRLVETWPSFLALRRRRLVETARPGGGAERVAELIVADLFTHALDWHVDDLNHQIGYADVLLTRLGIKYLVIETKRPGALAWSDAAVEAALEQATRYAVAQGETLLHHKYGIPARCFAYVGDPSRPTTWHLPYRVMDGSVDSKRLPKAIQAILTDYRGATVGSVPEPAIPAVLERLAGAARELGRMPDQRPDTAEAYQLLHDALLQIEKERRRR